MAGWQIAPHASASSSVIIGCMKHKTPFRSVPASHYLSSAGMTDTLRVSSASVAQQLFFINHCQVCRPCAGAANSNNNGQSSVSEYLPVVGALQKHPQAPLGMNFTQARRSLSAVRRLACRNTLVRHTSQPSDAGGGCCGCRGWEQLRAPEASMMLR